MTFKTSLTLNSPREAELFLCGFFAGQFAQERLAGMRFKLNQDPEELQTILVDIDGGPEAEDAWMEMTYRARHGDRQQDERQRQTIVRKG